MIPSIASHEANVWRKVWKVTRCRRSVTPSFNPNFSTTRRKQFEGRGSFHLLDSGTLKSPLRPRRDLRFTKCRHLLKCSSVFARLVLNGFLHITPPHRFEAQCFAYPSRTADSMLANSSSVRNPKCDFVERRPLFCRQSWMKRSMRRSGMSTIS